MFIISGALVGIVFTAAFFYSAYSGIFEIRFALEKFISWCEKKHMFFCASAAKLLMLAVWYGGLGLFMFVVLLIAYLTVKAAIS